MPNVGTSLCPLQTKKQTRNVGLARAALDDVIRSPLVRVGVDTGVGTGVGTGVDAEVGTGVVAD